MTDWLWWFENSKDREVLKEKKQMRRDTGKADSYKRSAEKLRESLK
jgi:hypothetical protein